MNPHIARTLPLHLEQEMFAGWTPLSRDQRSSARLANRAPLRGRIGNSSLASPVGGHRTMRASEVRSSSESTRSGLQSRLSCCQSPRPGGAACGLLPQE